MRFTFLRLFYVYEFWFQFGCESIVLFDSLLSPVACPIDQTSHKTGFPLLLIISYWKKNSNITTKYSVFREQKPYWHVLPSSDWLTEIRAEVKGINWNSTSIPQCGKIDQGVYKPWDCIFINEKGALCAINCYFNFQTKKMK